jgi:hypothetical protein
MLGLVRRVSFSLSQVKTDYVRVVQERTDYFRLCQVKPG